MFAITGCVDSGEYVEGSDTVQSDGVFDVFELKIDTDIGPMSVVFLRMQSSLC